jgi:hypothetical protein
MSMPARPSKPSMQTRRASAATAAPGAAEGRPVSLLRRRPARLAAAQLYRGVLACTYDASGQDGASR